TKSSPHEANQEDAGKGDQDRGKGQFHATASTGEARRAASAQGLIATGEAITTPLRGRTG
ncbi:hypothetical protein, partial [Lysobacter sp. TAB13]|uniref:hypothetical protein n=1 Tax=Lysobacter sp. TAB13 TaxID=3233065 RepID=UPI003F970892